ncbi:MAG TPA: glycosyltransferase [Candidatus Acidoferrum sp.]|nr:glycosyltransferase [Candidatus Acidoferrum sp.]
MKLSIVATLYQSAPYLREFHRRASAVARAFAGEDYEIVLVNDGSPDNSLDVAIQLADDDHHAIVVDLSRNFGHHRAMMTGLAHAGGEQVFLIDTDLEEEPEWLPAFAQQMHQQACDVVYGVQAQRKGNWFERWSGWWFYRVFKLLTGLALPANAVTARLMSRAYVDSLLRHQEREVFIPGLWHVTGFVQRPCQIAKHHSSASTYTFGRKIALLVNAITSFSNAPLVAIFYIGIVISLLALIYICYLVIDWLFYEKALMGWTSVIASIWLLGGMIISFIGVMGVYLAKIFSEVKQRPYTIVRRIYGRHRG